jgi:uncharacterized membrane protein YphA (DoxX/SURF4 family)
MAVSTAVFLILLRLAIGWHFFYEGAYKIESTWMGKTETNKPFTSVHYFREAPGPVGKLMRHFLGDPNDEALALLSVQPVPEGKDERSYPPKDRVPPGLDAAWKGYLARFSAHYHLDEAQHKTAQNELDKAEADAVHWLTDTTKPAITTKSFPNFKGSVNVEETMPKRIAEYRAKLDELRDVQERKIPLFERDVEGKRLTDLKAEVTRLRSGLLADLDKNATDKMKTALNGLLTAEQKELPALGAAPPPRLLSWIDFLTMWGLAVMGGCLIVGLFTRLNCILAAGFLLLLYLSAPPFPWLPVMEKTNSHFLFVNQLLIEMLALLALATTASGCWLGLDALLGDLLAPRPAPSAAPQSVVVAPEPAPEPHPLVKR